MKLSKHFYITILFLLAIATCALWQQPFYTYITLTLIYLGITSWGVFDVRLSYFVKTQYFLKQRPTKTIVLTFDDGPSENTEDVLKILKKNDIKATFFVIGRTDKKSLLMYKKIVNDGHTIAMHSYTHNYGLIYASLKNFKKDYYAISDLIYNTTGVRCKYYRFPGGSSNSVSKIDMRLPIPFLKDEGVEYVDWNVMSGDAVRISLSDKVLYKNVMTGVHSMKNSVVLMHDSLARGTTVRALPKIIKSLKKENYLILPIDETTPVVHHRIRKFS